LQHSFFFGQHLLLHELHPLQLSIPLHLHSEGQHFGASSQHVPQIEEQPTVNKAAAAAAAIKPKLELAMILHS
jgi:hypothetical protein